MKVAFCSSEVFPFAKTGGLGDVGGSLPLALQKAGLDVSIFMPGYRSVGQSDHRIDQLNDKVSRTTLDSGINVYFIDSARFFDREGLYGDSKGDYNDNLERFSYFCDETIRLIKELDLKPDIVHCHDWQTALIPVFIKEKYRNDPHFDGIKTVMTIHNLAYQGTFPKNELQKLGLNGRLTKNKAFEFHDRVNLLKAGLLYSDRVTTVSPEYAKEIYSKEFGCGLEDVLRSLDDQVNGILNGLDYEIWDPLHDRVILEQYSKRNYKHAKEKNKRHLQKELQLEVNEEIPLFGFVGRLSSQKGLDLILETIEELLQLNIQIVLLGMGEAKYEDRLTKVASRYPERLSFIEGYNEQLGHQIYAASDFFLMPSMYEPCGLSQMISLTYFTVPIVTRIGGLKDTIKPFGLFRKNGNGIIMGKKTGSSLLNAINKALKIYMNEKEFDKLRRNGQKSRFTWDNSAQQYRKIFECA